MNKFIRLLLISFVLTIMPNLSNKGSLYACWFGFEYYNTNFRFWLFQPDLVPSKVMRLLSYPELSNEPNQNDNQSGQRLYANGASDTSFYKLNVEEWQNALKTDASLKSAKNVKADDIHRILYNIDPDVFFNKMEGDSLKNNTFIKAIESSKPFMGYLKFAKICEQLMNFDDPWVAYSEGKDARALRKYMIVGDSIIKNKTTPLFIKERTSYQLIKIAHYLEDSAQVISLYNRFFDKTNSKSWVVQSAHFYYAIAHADAFKRNYLLAKTFEYSEDKKWRALQLYDNSDSILRGALTFAKNIHEKATMLTLPILTDPGRQLTNIKSVYAIDPKSPMLILAIQREINKIEDWIFTNRFTEFSTTGASDDYEENEKKKEKGMTQKQIDAQNLQSDLKYMDEVQGFINKVASEKKYADAAFWELTVAHLAFLKKDFETAKQHLAIAKSEKSTPLSIQTQIWLTELLCDIASTEHVGEETEAAILKFEAFLRKQKEELLDYASFRSQIMRFISERYIADGQTAKGVLILSKSTLTFGSIVDIWEKNFYHKLLEIGSPKDFEQVIDIVSRKPRQSLSDFEKWLASEPKAYESPIGCRGCYSDTWGKKPPPPQWNVSKLIDYEGYVYINRDELDSAYNVLKAVPEDYWQDYPYSSYMTTDPFKLVLGTRTWEGSEWDEETDQYKQSKAIFTKPQFIKRLIDLKKQVVEDPIKYEKNYYLIGSAYYNMTSSGSFWLMSQIWWNGAETSKQSSFEDNYTGGARAAAWFEKGVKGCKDEKLAALCCFMANECQHMHDIYMHDVKYANKSYADRPEVKTKDTPLWRTLSKRFKGADKYDDTDYWCQNFETLSKKYR
jgi:hypothetical protein